MFGTIPDGLWPIFSKQVRKIICKCPKCDTELDGVNPQCKCKVEWHVGLFGYYHYVPLSEHPDFKDYKKPIVQEEFE
jgi:hypothetical protein